MGWEGSIWAKNVPGKIIGCLFLAWWLKVHPVFHLDTLLKSWKVSIRVRNTERLILLNRGGHRALAHIPNTGLFKSVTDTYRSPTHAGKPGDGI